MIKNPGNPLIRFIPVLFLVVPMLACSQQLRIKSVINTKEAERIERVLASDNLKGRQVGTQGIDRAAQFIAGEFKAAGLQPGIGNGNNSTGYLQSFKMVRPKPLEVKWEHNGRELDPHRVVVVSARAVLEINEKSGYKVKAISRSANLLREASQLIDSGNYIVLVNESFAADFSRLNRFNRELFVSGNNTVFLMTNAASFDKFTIKVKQQVQEMPMANIVGMLPGKSRPHEYVVFSAHYDHLGIGRPLQGDSIYNGANDDAAGITAVILLAKYFRKLNNNERTLVFAAFTAEETGGYGSQYFSGQLPPEQVAAMINIEMIGTQSKWGKNSAYITGFEKTNMGKILQQNLKGTPFTFYPDPYPQENLFYRSDNATLALLGVPAHTISTSKMDSEKYYHTVDDEIETLDMENMAAIIRAIAQSSKTIISGKDTPSRVGESGFRD